MNTTYLVPIFTTYIDVMAFNFSYDYNLEELPPSFTERQIKILLLIASLRLLITILGVMANTFVILLQMKYKLVHKTNYIFGTFVNLSDLLHSVILLVECIFNFLYGESPIIIYAVSCTMTTHSYVCMCGVAVDRYLALRAIPFSYKRVVSIKKYMMAILVSFVVSAVLNFLLFRYFVNDLGDAIQIVPFVTVGATVPVVLLYILIGVSLSRSHRHLELPAAEKEKRLRQTRTIMFTFVSMLGTNVIATFPVAVIGFTLWYNTTDGNPYVAFSAVVISNVSLNVFLINYIVNPLIYFKLVLRKLMQSG